MRIALIGLRSIGPSAIGGVERAVEELSARYAEQGHDVTVFCRARYARDIGDRYRGVRIKKLPAIYTKHLEAITNTLAAVMYALRSFDIVHINATGPALLSFVPRLLGRKVVVTVHGLDWRRGKWGLAAKLALKVGAWAAAALPNETTVVSKTLRKYYADKYSKTVQYIPNGVTLPTHEPLSAATPFQLPEDSYLLFLGRLVPEKGCHTLIQAFRGLKTDKKLVIVGPPSHSEAYAESLRQLAAGDDRILFTGPLFGPQKDAAYRGAYCFVLPSSIEGMALVLLEAMSYGKCCLCSDISENLEVIDEEFDLVAPASPGASRDKAVSRNAAAATFKVGSVDDLRAQLDALLNDPGRVQSLSRRAHERVATQFDWDRVASQYLRVFVGLVVKSQDVIPG